MKVAVLGGGPAGAFTAELLAREGFPVTVIDEKLAWEKPCGGGLTAKAVEKYPFLASADAPKRFVHRAVLVASNGARAVMRLRQPLLIYSRRVLNGLLLDRAASAGAAVLQDRITAADLCGGRWQLTGKRGRYSADFCVVATGARNPLRQLGTELRPADAYVALGYYVPRVQDHIEIQFLRGVEGYIWVFPRPDHLSVGICGKIGPEGTAALRRRLERYMAGQGLPPAGSTFYCHLLPSLSAGSLDRNRVAGPQWSAVGDAAGLVDPITGEGLYYALRSADLLAACVREGCLTAYAARVREELTQDLRLAAQIARRFYRGRFLLAPVTTRMVQFCRRSRTFEGLMQDIFAGSQDYLTLKARLFRQMRLTFWELLASCWRRHDTHEPFQITSPV